MIITTNAPYTSEQIQKVRERFDVYIKTVIDIEKKICVSGMDRHFEGEQLLLASGSVQSNLWGGGIDVETKEIDYNSFINIRPSDCNTKNDIQSEEIKRVYKQLTEFFFQNLL